MPDGNGPSGGPATAGPQIADTASGDGRPPLWTRMFSKNGTPAASSPSPGTAGASGQVAPSDRELMLARIAAFEDKRVSHVAIPRADIVGVDTTTKLSELLRIFSDANHSRLPVYRGDLDDPIGMVHIKDVIGVLARADVTAGLEAEDENQTVAPIVRKILYVPPSMPVTELLLRMQATRVHMALVIDEFGGTDGLVTIEDLVELIVGDIRDEHDDSGDFPVKQLSDRVWEAHARTPLEELATEIGHDLNLEDSDADTLGGLAFTLTGRVPVRGEIISHPSGAELSIVEADARRIRLIKIKLPASFTDRNPSDPAAEPAGK